jgi:integral membrane protein
MALKPKPSDVPRIRSALKLYRVFAYITGAMLLLLVLEMIFKYSPIQREIELGGAHGFIALVPDKTVLAVNLSTGILIAHGWLYVIYLFSDFRLWSILRWPFSRFIAIALGGVVPVLSFIVDHYITRRVKGEIAELVAAAPLVETDPSAASAAAPEVTH